MRIVLQGTVHDQYLTLDQWQEVIILVFLQRFQQGKLLFFLEGKEMKWNVWADAVLADAPPNWNRLGVIPMGGDKHLKNQPVAPWQMCFIGQVDTTVDALARLNAVTDHSHFKSKSLHWFSLRVSYLTCREHAWKRLFIIRFIDNCWNLQLRWSR